LRELEAAADQTAAAMVAGKPLIYQGSLFNGRWRGRTDFLVRTAEASDLGDYSYEVVDAKLARQATPYAVHQLSLYNSLVAEVQGRAAENAYLILGDGETVTVNLSRYASLHRHTIRRLEAITGAPTRETYPEPVAHCDICALSRECRARRVADDHLSLVANARRDHRERLTDLGLTTVAALAGAPETTDAGSLGAARFETLHSQAALQVSSRDSGEPKHRHLAPEHGAGYAALPTPSAGDLFFDLEGDPYVDDGVEYLWGWTTGGVYACVWAHDEVAEKVALETFVDRVVELRKQHPDLHVFHYAPHEISKLRSLSVKYATRESEVDQMLRQGVLVDLYAAVRHGLQVGEESYSLKALERHHDFERREQSIREGGGSIVAYENWLQLEDNDLLESIRAYNEDDCRSTESLRDWLIGGMRPEAETELGVDFNDYRDAKEASYGPPAWLLEVAALISQLTDGLPGSAADDSAEDAERRLVSELLLYHYRESKPEWWRYFDLRAKPIDELFYERDAVAGLSPDEAAPVQVKQSLHYKFRFPTQEVRLTPGQVEDPTTGERYKLVASSDDHIVLARSATAPAPTPSALIPGQPIPATVLRKAIMALASSLIAGDGRFGCVRSLLTRESPRLSANVTLGEDASELAAAALALDHSILPIQGPPGTGKTFRGARMIVAALEAGLRVGITAQSHAAIQNMLRDVEDYAATQEPSFTAIYKGSGYESKHGLVAITTDNKEVTDDHQLVAGTSWLFARPEHRERFDLLFVDEAGQLALAHGVAAGLAAKNLVFLGDPQQLPQVTKSEHPGGSGASILEHLLQGAAVIVEGRGVLLTESWRMHPAVCAFVSDHSYERKLHSRTECSLREIAADGDLSGTGLRVLEVPHEGRSQASPEEAQAIADACAALLDGGRVTDDKGQTKELRPRDIMVVAPYNLAVQRIQDQVPRGVRVGTVDRFQGQQAAVVFYALTCSSGEDVPRGIGFLFDANRFNVAVSRAECLAVLVHSPALLDADCRTLDAMELVDGVCRFVEMADAIGAPA
jgi:predicted RecB family nuclease